MNGSAEGGDAEYGGDENGPPQKRARAESADVPADNGTLPVDGSGVSSLAAGKAMR